ncbi:hypothetical protein ACFE04_001693 [Oxalis oulophora]
MAYVHVVIIGKGAKGHIVIANVIMSVRTFSIRSLDQLSLLEGEKDYENVYREIEENEICIGHSCLYKSCKKGIIMLLIANVFVNCESIPFFVVRIDNSPFFFYTMDVVIG